MQKKFGLAKIKHKRRNNYARVAEKEYAKVLKTLEEKLVWVQIPPFAPASAKDDKNRYITDTLKSAYVCNEANGRH